MTNSLKIVSKSEYLKENAPPNQEEVWNTIARPWKEYRQGKIPIVVEFLKDKSGLVIDLGCGSARNMIKNDNIEYYGVDFSLEQIKNAESLTQDQGIKAKFFKLGADKLDKNIFMDNMFDYGIFMATLHCLETKEERDNALKEFYRVLKPGAEALISVWSSQDLRFNGLKGDIYMSWKEENVNYMRSYYLYEKQELIDLLKSKGFEIIHFYEKMDKDRFSKKNWIVKIKKFPV